MFARQVEAAEEAGASFCVVASGEVVIDLWGGLADRDSRRPWSDLTFAPVMSSGKALTALCAAVLIDRRELDIDSPVARYWPEFAQAGKEDILVRWVLSHRSGVAALDSPPSAQDWAAWDPIVSALAAQRPLWSPGESYLYHAYTFGHVVGEIVRRISGRRPAAFFEEEIASPYGLDAWIVPPSERISDLASLSWTAAPSPPTDPDIAKVAFTGATFFMHPEQWTIEQPSFGYASARGLAGAFAVASSGDLLAEATIDLLTHDETAGVPPIEGSESLFPTGIPRWSLGFMVPSQFAPQVLRGPRAFGHLGSGGSFGFADLDRGIAVAFVPNRLVSSVPDPRAAELVDAVYAALDTDA